VERDVVSPGPLAEEETGEFMEAIADCKPASAPSWPRSRLPRTKVDYAFQMLGAVDAANGWDVGAAVYDGIRECRGGILQADGEGFTNEDGCHILWQFSDSVDGPWSMAVLREDGGWDRFETDMRNRNHRAAFLAGRVPDGVLPE
jgi:hypothetical protein